MFDSFLLLQPHEAQLVRQLIEETKTYPKIGQRMKIISARFLGFPYIVDQLIGSETETEIFVTRMDGFDCVTYIETALALAGAKDYEGFLNHLRETIYQNGIVEWRSRLHYLSLWSQYHIRRGFLIDLTKGEDAIPRTKTLDYVKGLKPVTVSYHFFPNQKAKLVGKWIEDGDLIFWASARKGLDVFHVGMLFRDGDRVFLRHATKHSRAVIEQDLAEFAKINHWSGFFINRPVENIK